MGFLFPVGKAYLEMLKEVVKLWSFRKYLHLFLWLDIHYIHIQM
jgi:hypothetical protein